MLTQSSKKSIKTPKFERFYYKIRIGVAYGNRTRNARATISRDNRFTKATPILTFVIPPL